MVFFRSIVSPEARAAVVLHHQDVEVAIVVNVPRCAAAEYVGAPHGLSGFRRYFVKSALAVVVIEEGTLFIGDSGELPSHRGAECAEPAVTPLVIRSKNK